MDNNLQSLGAVFPLLMMAWGVTVIIVTFKVWAACNRIDHIAKVMVDIAAQQSIERQGIQADIRLTNSLLQSHLPKS